MSDATSRAWRTIRWASLIASAVQGTTATAFAQTLPDQCAPKAYRWLEDCRALADRDRDGIDALRFVPLNEGSSLWATFGGEYRLRVEALNALDFGIGGAPDYVSTTQRGLAHADLRSAGGPRLFVQLSIARESGRKPAARPFDESAIDAAQLFVDVPFGDAAAGVTVRLGRQEFNFGGNRLVSVREAAPLRRAFDAVKIDWRRHGWRGAVFTGRPVLPGPGAFDDRRDRSDRFRGLTIEAPATPRDGAWSLFYFDRRRSVARTLDATGKDRRHTLGFRYVFGGEHWDATAQAAGQVGTLAGRGVRAGGVGTDFGYRPNGASGIRYGVNFGIGSGDTDPGDGEVNTFDPIYPNLGAFSDAPLWYPSNQIAAGANVARAFGAVALRADVVLLRRTSLNDALYANPGRPLAFPNNNDRFGAALIEASVRWTINPHLGLYGSLVRAEALDAVRAAGGEDASFGLIQLTARF